MPVNHADLHCDVHEGSGPWLLLVHGMLSSRAQWQPNLDALSRVCRPVVIELLGHGRSPSPSDPACYAPASYVAAFEKIRRSLGAERWLICGQSLGAALTLRYALERPEKVIAQVFTNSNSAVADARWGEMVRRGLGTMAVRLQREGRAALEESPVHPRHSRHLPPEVRDALVADCELHDPRGVGLTGVETVPPSSVREQLKQNSVPALMVLGTREKRFQRHADYIRAHMPALEVVTAEVGHAVNIEAAPLFNEAVSEFVLRHAHA